MSGVRTYQRTLKGSSCGGAWQASDLRRGYRPAQDPEHEGGPSTQSLVIVTRRLPLAFVLFSIAPEDAPCRRAQ